MSDLYEKLAALSPERRALFERKLAAQGLSTNPHAIPARPSDAGPIPLSFAQRRLWFLQQLDPSNTAYNMMTALRFHGALDQTALQNAIFKLIERHEALRTRFAVGADGEPIQIIEQPPTARLRVIDLSTAPNPMTAAQTTVSQETAEPYDLSSAPVRIALLRLSETDHVLNFGLHHIAGDRWSLGLLVRDLAALFEANTGNAAAPLPELSIQTADWAQWQRSNPHETLQNQLDYWTTQLGNGLPKLELPFDHPRGLKPSTRGAQSGFGVPAGLERDLRAMAQARGVSLFTVLLAGFNVLMHRYTGAVDIPVGSEVANRARPELQNIMGPLVNTLVMRSDLSNDPDFNTVLSRVSKTVQNALKHQDVPFEQVVEALNPERQLNELMPLFQAKFDLQQAAKLPKTLNGLGVERFPLGARTAKYELRFNFEDHGDHLQGRVEYCADLFDQTTIERMSNHYLRLLAAIVDHPEMPISRLPMLDAEEHQALLELAQGPDVPPLPGDTVHTAFEAQVQRTPDAIAVHHHGTTTSYRALDDQANAIAQALAAREIAPQDRIGICMARSVDMLAAVLGVLKAGGAYVPLDPAYPADRLGFIAADAGVKIALTDGRILPFEREAPVALIDVTTIPPNTAPVQRGNSSDLAVIIYTSGSTGQPKGVALEHRSIRARLAWGITSFSPSELSAVLFATSISFDLSIFEMFVPLAQGGALVMVETLLDLPKLSPDVAVTLINTVPSLLRELVKHHDLPPTVQTVNLAGEFFPPVLHAKLRSFTHLKTINNLYGPSEDTIFSSGNPVQDWNDLPLPIGRPLPGTRVYVLDPQGQLLPHGAVGEIYVAGEGLARGYLNRPEKTAQMFVPDPYHIAPDAIMYKTGDRGFWRPDGRIGIVGRIDTQIKIRGLRIESGEIETALETHPRVSEAFVIPVGDPGDPNRQLAAYITPPAGAEISAETLRRYLEARLPVHMVPTRWQVMADLPRMPNGKVDRKALAGLQQAVPAGTFVAPQSDVEIRVCKLWSQLLEIEQVGLDDNFFQLGGHSLMAMRLLTQLQGAFDVDLTIAQLFQALTPRAQAELIARTEGQKAEVIPAQQPHEQAVATMSDAEVDAMLAKMLVE